MKLVLGLEVELSNKLKKEAVRHILGEGETYSFVFIYRERPSICLGGGKNTYKVVVMMHDK